MPPERAVFLMGPTAVGKSDLAIRLADSVPKVGLISVDSVMVYRGLNIGTAKPSPELLARHPHALVDIRSPTEPYSVAAFLADASDQVSTLRRAGRIPVLVGGSMLYFKVLRNGLARIPRVSSEIRSKVRRFAEAHGAPALHRRLCSLDPETAARLQPNDTQRLQRATEICLATGSSLSEWQRQPAMPGLGEPVQSFVLLPPTRSVLHERIAKRLRRMLDQGLVDEVRGLADKYDLVDTLPAARAVGYKQILDCIRGRVCWSGMEDRVLAATRQMAKRQLTWLNSFKGLTRLPEDANDAFSILEKTVQAT